MAWKKRMCYVVVAFYRENEDLPDDPEIEAYSDYEKAEKAMQKFVDDPDIAAVYLDEKECEIWVCSLEELFEQADQIVKNEKLTVHQKDVLLADILTDMERRYHIPAIKNPEWETEHKEIIDTYRKISDMRSI